MLGTPATSVCCMLDNLSSSSADVFVCYEDEDSVIWEASRSIVAVVTIIVHVLDDLMVLSWCNAFQYT